VNYGKPLQLVLLRVRGHQDDERNYDDLTRLKQLNVLANRRTTAALKDLRAAGQPTFFPPAETIFVMPPVYYQPRTEHAPCVL
jgi:hypothetical protein